MQLTKYTIVGALVVVLAALLWWLFPREPDRSSADVEFATGPPNALTDKPAKGDTMGEHREEPVQEEPGGPTELSEEEKAVLTTWYRKDYSIEKAAQVGGICLRHRLSRRQIIDLIGEPSHQRGEDTIAYNFAPSQLLELEFDENALTVDAKVTGTPVNPGGTLRP